MSGRNCGQIKEEMLHSSFMGMDIVALYKLYIPTESLGRYDEDNLFSLPLEELICRSELFGDETVRVAKGVMEILHTYTHYK